MKLFDLFRKPVVESDHSDGCEFCDAVKRFGRSGEKKVEFESGEKCAVEIINESRVEGRKCYSLNASNNAVWTELPIKYCPFCGKRLGAK